MHVVCEEMASLVERLRVRSDRRPIYNLDESDEEADFVKKKSGTGSSSEKFEKFERPDAVILALSPLFDRLHIVPNCFNFHHI